MLRCVRAHVALRFSAVDHTRRGHDGHGGTACTTPMYSRRYRVTFICIWPMPTHTCTTWHICAHHSTARHGSGLPPCPPALLTHAGVQSQKLFRAWDMFVSGAQASKQVARNWCMVTDGRPWAGLRTACMRPAIRVQSACDVRPIHRHYGVINDGFLDAWACAHHRRSG